jgi:hypothetical protein
MMYENLNTIVIRNADKHFAGWKTASQLTTIRTTTTPHKHYRQIAALTYVPCIFSGGLDKLRLDRVHLIVSLGHSRITPGCNIS